MFSSSISNYDIINCRGIVDDLVVDLDASSSTETHASITNSSLNAVAINGFCSISDSKLENISGFNGCKEISTGARLSNISAGGGIGLIVNNNSVVTGSILGTEAKIDNSSVSNGSEVSGDVSNNSTINNAYVGPLAMVNDSTITSGSRLTDEARVINQSVISASKVGTRGYVDGGKAYSDSTIFGAAKLLGAIISNSHLSGAASVRTDKTGKTCDGITDSDPEDPCMKTPE